MTYTLRNVEIGDCFRIIDGDLNDKPSYADSCERASPTMPPGWEACDVDDKDTQVSWWEKHGDEKVIFLEHYSRDPRGTQLTRGHIRIGECFQYIGDGANNDPFIMVSEKTAMLDLPEGWRVSYIERTNINHRLVRRVPRWDEDEGSWRGIPKGETAELPRGDAPAKPPVGSPLRKLLDKKVDGVTGETCFKWLQEAQQAESLCRTQSGFVSTLATAPLNEAQAALALEIWPLMLAELRAKQDREDAAKAVSVVVQHDELEPW